MNIELWLAIGSGVAGALASLRGAYAIGQKNGRTKSDPPSAPKGPDGVPMIPDYTGRLVSVSERIRDVEAYLGHIDRKISAHIEQCDGYQKENRDTLAGIYARLRELGERDGAK